MLESGARRGRLRRRICSACIWDGAVRTPTRRRSALTLRSASAFRNQTFLVNAPKNGLDPCLIPPLDPVVRVDRAADLAHFSHRFYAELPHEQLALARRVRGLCVSSLRASSAPMLRSRPDRAGRRAPQGSCPDDKAGLQFFGPRRSVSPGPGGAPLRPPSRPRGQLPESRSLAHQHPGWICSGGGPSP